ncbi:hypothetical protein L6R50_11655 [Myxococcota bacterium]|nr:hypothetical protein [Myxococcota bacterium]
MVGIGPAEGGAGPRAGVSSPAPAPPLPIPPLVWGLCLLGLGLRTVVDIDGVLDMDTGNFGLAALHFDPVHHQPQPPGYPGWVAFLKLIHALAPGLAPEEVAKWGSRLAGAATVPVAAWACAALGSSAPPAPRAGSDPRPVAAATFAALHPVLWYYGADGQPHAAEGLCLLALVGAAARLRRRPRSAGLAALALAAGLCGSLRQTIPLLATPILIWALWGRSARDWLLAGAAGAVGVGLWMGALGWVVEDPSMYARAGRALIHDLIFANFSPFGERAGPASVLRNVSIVAAGVALGALPAIAWARGRRDDAAAPARGWRSALVAVVALDVAFHSLVFAVEIGYLLGVAALACLVPATWGVPLGPGTRRRALLAGLALPAAFVLLPAAVPLPFGAGILPATSLTRVAEEGVFQTAYRDAACDAAAGRPALLVTDSPVMTHTRMLPWRCPGLRVAHVFQAGMLNPSLEGVIVVGTEPMWSVPTEVPLEAGPPASRRLPGAVAVVIAAPDASDPLLRRLAAQATCGPEAPPGSARIPLKAWPAACVDRIRAGRSEVLLTPVEG